MIRVVGPNDCRREGAINTTSTSKTWSRGLSPMLLGPVQLYGEYVAQNAENAWQYSKVFQCHVDPLQRPTDQYWDWARTGWGTVRGCRYPMGRGAKPLFSLWNGAKLDYIEARKQIYVPLYARAVLATEAWDQLQDHYIKYREVTLFDFDGYDHRSLGMSLNDVLNCPTRKMGHAFVLAMLLGEEL